MQMLVKILLVKQKPCKNERLNTANENGFFPDIDYFFVLAISSEKYCLDLKSWDLELYMTLHKKWSFSLRIFWVNCENFRKLRI